MAEMQTARPDISDFVKAPPFKNPESCQRNAQCRLSPAQLLPAFAMGVAGHAEGGVSGPRQYRVQYDTIVRSPRLICSAQCCFVENLCKPPRYPAFTRFNVFLRDGFSCQYCGSPQDLTFDHVIPRRAGGRTTWENVVAACGPVICEKAGVCPSRPIWCHATNRASRPCMNARNRPTVSTKLLP